MRRPFLHFCSAFALVATTSGCSIQQTDNQTVGKAVVVDPSPDTCIVYLIKDKKVVPVHRSDETCLSSQEAMQQLLLGVEDEEGRSDYTSDLPPLVNEFPRVHYAFKNNSKTTMTLPIGLGSISELGMQQISCTIMRTHDGVNLVVQGSDGVKRDLVDCPS